MLVQKKIITRGAESFALKKIHLLDHDVEVLRASYVSHNFSRHMHEDYALGVIEEGAMGFRYRGEDLVASSGLVNLVVPGEVHDGHSAADNGWTYSMFYLPPELLFAAAQESSNRPVQPHFRMGVLDDHDLAAQVRLVHKKIFSSSSALENETMLLKLLVSWIFRHGDEKASCPEPGNEHRAVQLAREFMEDCFADEINLGQLSGLGGLSYYHFIRVFEREVGMTPHAYLMQARVNRSRSMLGSSMRLADIAACCGFCDQSHLTRSFRRQFGVTPGRYRTFIQNNT